MRFPWQRQSTAPLSRGYDIIGDVHGQCGKLKALLKRLGYHRRSGVWRHPNRQAIFVGDLVDRGPEQVATVELVRAMVTAGAARCVLGNHEFNAIAWATEDPQNPGEYLRSRTRKGNHKQHEAFLREVQGTARHQELVDWFKGLPLWIDLGGLRVVHACWHQESIDRLTPLLRADGSLTDELVILGSRKGHWVFEAIETVCKGPHLTLPDGVTFTDKDGRVRDEVRLRWWQDGLVTYQDAAIGPAAEVAYVPATPIALEDRFTTYQGPPVIFGHYWFRGDPAVITPQFACVDYSAAHLGPLVAYRWDGEAALDSAKLEWVPSSEHPR